MTFPRVESDLLMAAPSFSRSPVAPVESARSLTQEGRKNGQGCMVPLHKQCSMHDIVLFACVVDGEGVRTYICMEEFEVHTGDVLNVLCVYSL